MLNLTEEQKAIIPVRHLSHSAIRTYLTDRQLFFKQYIRLLFEGKKGAALIEGVLFHGLMEDFWKNPETSVEGSLSRQLLQIEADIAAGLVDFGKTGSLEKSVETAKRAFDWYCREMPVAEYRTRFVGSEVKFTDNVADLEGNVLPVPMKAVMDLIVLTEPNTTDYEIIDYKLVSTVTEQSEINMGYQIQAVINWFVCRQLYGKNPVRFTFHQVKKSKNRDGGPQVVPYVVEYTPELINTVLELYSRIVRELAGLPLIDDMGIPQFLPNPFAMWGAEESWKDFTEEVNGRKYTPEDFARAKGDDVELIDL